MKAFLTPLQGLAEFEQIKEKSKTNKGILQVSGCMESQKSHLMYGLSGIAPYRLILAEDERRAREIYEDYRFYDRKVYSYPAKDLLFFQADIHGNLLIRQRMKVIKALLEEKELTVVTSIDGCMDFLESLEKIKEQLIHYESDSTVDTEQLKNQLVALGYERVGQVEMPGQFSVRGGIVDIYCLTEENPWRIELWGDEIDSIRSFDPESQRSLENLEELTIYPAVEHIGDKDMVSFLDYFPEERTIIFLDEPNRLTEKGGAVEEEYRQSRMHREEKGSRNLPENWLCSFEQLQKELNKRNCISVCALEPKQAGWKVREKFYLEVKSISAYNNSFELLVKDLHQYKKQGYRIALLSGSRTRAERLAKDLQEEGLAAFYGQDYDREICPGEIMVVYGHAKKGFEYPLIKFAVMTESDIFGQEQKFHVCHINLISSCIHTGNLLLNAPAFRKLHLLKLTYKPHSVVLDHNTLRLMDDIHGSQTLWCQIFFILDHFHNCVCKFQFIHIIFFFAFFAKDQQSFAVNGKILLLQCKIQESSLSAFQESRNQINGNSDIIHHIIYSFIFILILLLSAEIVQSRIYDTGFHAPMS
jgi:transcription-repair coupling factor (superfamily II helicase)